MTTKYTKKDEYTLEVKEPKMVEQASDIETETKTYNYSFLLEQKENITKQRDKMISLKEKELAEVEALIAECEKLGIVSEPIISEPIK